MYLSLLKILPNKFQLMDYNVGLRFTELKLGDCELNFCEK